MPTNMYSVVGDALTTTSKLMSKWEPLENAEPDVDPRDAIELVHSTVPDSNSTYKHK